MPWFLNAIFWERIGVKLINSYPIWRKSHPHFLALHRSRRQWHPTPVLLPEYHLDRGAWWAAVHGVVKRQTRLSDFTFTFHFPALEKEMATHSSVLAWRIPGTGEPGGLPSMGLHRVGYDWSNLAAAAAAADSTFSQNQESLWTFFQEVWGLFLLLDTHFSFCFLIFVTIHSLF